MPARFQLDPAEFERLRVVTEPMAGPIAKDAATERFSAAVAPLGVPTIDLLPVLRSAPHGQFFAGTVHLTAGRPRHGGRRARGVHPRASTSSIPAAGS